MSIHNKSIKTYFAFILLALSLIACGQLSGTPGLGDSLYPEFGNSGYQVEHYTLDITVMNVAKGNLTATTTIQANATQILTAFNLDFIGFEITSLKVNDHEAQYSRDGQELRIKPSVLLTKGERFTVEIQYNGSPKKMRSIAIPIQTGWVRFDGGSYVLSEPDGSASYYPVNDHPLDKASYTFNITVPKPFEVAANGILTETISNNDTSTFIFEARDPMASYLATINIGDFDIETSKSSQGVPIRNYFAADLPKDTRNIFARQDVMLDYFSGLFGEYPFEVYGSLVLDTPSGAALENQTLSIFGSDVLDSRNIQRVELVVAHELAHQWFGNSVSVADWSDIWLNEGFATYAEGLWIEHNDGHDAINEWAMDIYTDASNSPDHYLPPGSPAATDLFNDGVYDRGALTLHALRFKIGDELFFKILKNYVKRYQGANASTDNFIAIAEEFSGQDLQEFFNNWLYKKELMPISELGN